MDSALIRGSSDASSAVTLSKFLSEHGRHRKLTAEKILVWADRYRKKYGKWPSKESGDIEGSGGETWAALNSALKRGLRGLPSRSSLSKFLKAHRPRSK